MWLENVHHNLFIMLLFGVSTENVQNNMHRVKFLVGVSLPKSVHYDNTLMHFNAIFHGCMNSIFERDENL